MHDAVIIGAGPAGLTAAIYTLRAGLSTLVIEDPATLSQAGYAASVENLTGFPEGIRGSEFIQKGRQQITAFGAEVISGRVETVRTVDNGKYNLWDIALGGRNCRSMSVIAASGASPKRLNVPGEESFLGKGVSYCAICDGLFFRNKAVAVAGGGNSAVEEALFLTKFASKVYIIHRRNALRAVKLLQDEALSNDKIEIIWDSVIEEISGDGKVSQLKLRNAADNTMSRLDCEGLFVSIGSSPNTDFVRGLADLDESGYIITDKYLSSSRPGIFACGDCRDTALRQIITACGDGALAGTSCQQYIDKIKGRLYQ